jgi:hypothetical protein
MLSCFRFVCFSTSALTYSVHAVNAENRLDVLEVHLIITQESLYGNMIFTSKHSVSYHYYSALRRRKSSRPRRK